MQPARRFVIVQIFALHSFWHAKRRARRMCVCKIKLVAWVRRICCGGRKYFNFTQLKYFSFLCATTTMVQDRVNSSMRETGSFKFGINLPENKSTIWDDLTVRRYSGPWQKHAMSVSWVMITQFNENIISSYFLIACKNKIKY